MPRVTPDLQDADRAAFHRRALLLVALLGGVASYFTFAEFLFEDSYITLRYATNLAAGRGFVFQTGDRVFGTSAPLWAMILAGPIALGADPEVVLDVAFCAALAFLAYSGGRLLQRLGTPRAGIAFAVAIPLGIGRMQAYWGMETPLFIALLFSAWISALDRRFALSGVVLGLACVARYEGYAFAASMALALASQRNWRGIRAGGTALVSVALPWLLFAWIYFGNPVPLPALTKGGHCSAGRYFERSWIDLPHDIFWPSAVLGYRYAVGFLVGVLACVFGAIGVGRWIRSRAVTALGLPLGAMFVYATLIATRPGPLCTWHRAPLHLVLVLCALFGIATLTPRWLTGRYWGRVGAALAATAVLGSVPIQLHASATLRNTFQYVGREIAYPEIAEFLRDTGLNQLTVLTWEPGYLAFMSDVRVIDLSGLATPAPALTRDDSAPWDDFPAEADLVLLRAPWHPEGFELVFEGSMGAWLFARSAVAARYANAIADFRAADPPRAEALALSAGAIPIVPAYRDRPFVLGAPGTRIRLDPEQDMLALTAETPLLWIDRPHVEIEFQTSTPALVQLQLVVRGEVVHSSGNDVDPESTTVRWDLSPWLGRAAKVRFLALAGSRADGNFGTVEAVEPLEGSR